MMGNVVTTGAASGRVGQREHVAGEIMVKELEGLTWRGGSNCSTCIICLAGKRGGYSREVRSWEDMKTKEKQAVHRGDTAVSE